MLRVRRDSVDIPTSLTSDAARSARLAVKEYLRLPAERREQRRPPSDERRYRASDVVDALRRLFRDKCAYCESTIRLGEDQVEHFRPRSFATDLNGAEERDYYVWLDLDWENILLACSSCSKAKGSLFPVASRRARPRATLDEVFASERPELLDPTRDDPWTEIRMTTDGFCRPLRRRGEVTIAVLQLNRPQLVEQRAKDLLELKATIRAALRPNEDERISLLFHPSREFVGSRLDTLHRALLRWVPPTPRMPTARNALPAWFNRAVSDASEEDLGRLAHCFEEVFDEDTALPVLQPRPLDQVAKEGGRLPPMVPNGSGRRFPHREITSIQIRDFKGIERLDLSFAWRSDRRRELPALVLLGENSAGKSTILEAIALTLIGINAAARVPMPLSDFLRRDDPDGWNIVDPPPPKVTVNFRDDGEPANLEIQADGRRMFGTKSPSVLVLAYGARRHFSDKASAPTQPFHLVRNLLVPDRPMPSPGLWLQQISADPMTFNAVARTLRVILALDESDELILDDAGRPSVRVLGRPCPVERLSEGYRTLFSLAVDIMRNLLRSWRDLERARAVVLIDEIETHLHPRWKMRVLTSFRKAFPGVQFIVTTHDPLCLRGMDDGEVEVIERGANSDVHKLEDLPSVSGMRTDQLLTSEYFGLFSTFDPDLELDIARLSDEIASGASPSDADDELISKVVLGDTMKQQLIHEALDRYLEQREQRRGEVHARRDAVQAVLQVLKSDSDDSETA